MALNQDSMLRINNIVSNLRTSPFYKMYDVRSYLYDFRSGAHAIHLFENEQAVNLFLFFPGNKGEISSIAIYGSSLNGHLQAIRSSMKIFGMDVDEVEYDNQGLSPYVDVYLKPYSPLNQD